MVLIFVWSYLVLIVFVWAYLYIRRGRTDAVQFECLLCCLPATRTKYSVMYMFEDYTQWKRVYWIRVTIPTWHDLVLEQIDDFSRLYWFMEPYNFVAFFPLAAEKHYKMSSQVMYYWTVLFVSARGKMDSRVMHRFNVGGTMAMKYVRVGCFCMRQSFEYYQDELKISCIWL